MLLMNPEMQFGRITFSSFCQRATFHTAWTYTGRRAFDRSSLSCRDNWDRKNYLALKRPAVRRAAARDEQGCGCDWVAVS
jgi:hypothetical protein